MPLIYYYILSIIFLYYWYVYYYKKVKGQCSQNMVLLSFITYTRIIINILNQSYKCLYKKPWYNSKINTKTVSQKFKNKKKYLL